MPHVLLICPYAIHLYRFANSRGTKTIRPQNAYVLHKLCLWQIVLGVVFFFLLSLLFFPITAAIFWPAVMQNSRFSLKAAVCQNGNLIDYLLVSKAFNHSFGRASKHALSQERVVWARKALALKRGCHSD